MFNDALAEFAFYAYRKLDIALSNDLGSGLSAQVDDLVWKWLVVGQRRAVEGEMRRAARVDDPVF